MKVKTWFFQNISKIDKLLARRKDLYRLFLKRSHTDGQQVREMVLSITNHPGNASQNYRDVTSYLERVLLRIQRKVSHFSLLVEILIDTATMENSMYIPHKVWKYHMIHSPTLGIYLKEITLSKRSTLPSSLQHYSQWPRHRNNLSVYGQWMENDTHILLVQASHLYLCQSM